MMFCFISGVTGMPQDSSAPPSEMMFCINNQVTWAIHPQAPANTDDMGPMAES